MRRLVLAFACLLAAASVARAKPCPNIMLVLDQSGSMAQDPDGHPPDDPGFKGPSKWELLQDTIVDVLKEYGDRVPFGLELFTSDSLNDEQACQDAAKITVPLSHVAAGDIIAKIKAAKPDRETNTGEAIRAAAMDMALHNPNKANYIILVTDGNPNCNPADRAAAASDPSLGRSPTYTYSQIEAAKNMKPSVKTFVIGFDGSGVRADWLDQFAYLGGTRSSPNCGSQNMPPEPCYYRAGRSAQEFKDLFDKIVRDASGGEFGGNLCDDSCFSMGCPMGQLCVTEETNPEPHCVNDPCGGRKCNGDTFCRGGGCIPACTKGCAAKQTCVDGKCVEDRCSGVSCGAGQVCNPKDGACIDFPCPNCTPGSVCDVATARCVVDQCKIITCPKGTGCVNNGNCQAGVPGASSGGCSTAPRPSSDYTSLVAFGLALFSFGMAFRRRRA